MLIDTPPHIRQRFWRDFGGVSSLPLLAVLLVTFSLAWASSAAAVVAPHIVQGADTDTCAMCHRAHTSASSIERTDVFTGTRTGSALIVGADSSSRDVYLCYSCHGVDSLGALSDVQTSFTSDSSHTIAPDIAPYGPSPMDCSSCHDSHGTERDTDGEPFAALLRSRSESDTDILYYQGDEYCTACHENTAANTWDGLTIWEQTAHSREITPTASGTLIVCSVCHQPHGSNNPPLIVETIYPPSAPETLSVPANDRWLCFTCHAQSHATYPYGATYQTSSHAVSEATVTATGEWASAEDTRTVGECQNCHNPMGTSDGAGAPIDKLAVAASSALCERCHFDGSEIATDLARFEFPDTEATAAEVVVAWDSEQLATTYDRFSVWTQETTGTAPRDLLGPRAFDVPGSAVDAASGDIEGDGVQNIVIADGASKHLDVFEPNALAGLSPVTYSIDATPTYVAIADFYIDGTGLPEIAVISRSDSAPYTSNLYIYRYSDVGPSLKRVTGPVALGNDASGIAAGDVRGTLSDDIAVTCMGDDTLRVFTESTITSETLSASSYATRQGPRGPSIGDAAGVAGTEIVIANSAEVNDTVSVFSGAGSLVDSYDATLTAYPGAIAYDTLVADVLPNVAGAETYVALKSELGTSGFNVFPRAAGGLDEANMQPYTTGALSNTASLAAADVDSDSRTELLVGNAGRWPRSSAAKEPASVQVFSADVAGTGIAGSPVTLWSEGAHAAGGDPAVVPVDLGGFGESRHPVGEIEGAHVSTETVIAARHVECVDCHNVHEATSTVPPLGAPLVYGALKGTWGISVTNVAPGSYTPAVRQGVLYEYETCFKCHAGGNVAVSDDIAMEFNTTNASFHAIETSTTDSQVNADSFVLATPAWSNSSVLYCASCHGNSDVDEPVGTHSSPSAPILSGPYWGTTPDTGDLLCYDCHKYTVYYSGAEDNGPSGSPAGSNFYDTDLGASPAPRLHYQHVSARGLGCESCHESHGLDREHLIRDGVGYTHAADGGYCANECHSTGTLAPERHDYARP